MLPRRDQVEAQSYLLSRLTGALVNADPDGAEPPNRRDTRGLVNSTMAGLLAIGLVALVALLSAHGSTAWRQPGTLIVDKSTGSRFLFRGNVLRPVLNLASARLAVGSDLKTALVRPATLSSVPRGAPLGIPGAPDALPQPAQLNAGIWRVCAATRTALLPNFPAVRVITDVDAQPSGTRLAAQQAFLANNGEATYLIWQGRSLRLGRTWAADVLGWGGLNQLWVSPTWLDLLPAGPEIDPVDVPNRGDAGPKIDGAATQVGQLFHVTGTSPDGPFYLLQPDGLVPLTRTQYLLTSSDPDHKVAVREISAAGLASAEWTGAPLPSPDQPATPPQIVPADGTQAPCLEFPGHQGVADPDVVLAGLPAGARPVGDSAESAEPADAQLAVHVRPGGGALLKGFLPQYGTLTAPDPAPSGTPAAAPSGLPSAATADTPAKTPAATPTAVTTDLGSAEATSAPNTGDGGDSNLPLQLVSDSGVLFPLGDSGDLRALGYDPEQAEVMPAPLVALLSRGPTLTVHGAT